MRVSIITENSPARLAEKINFFIKEMDQGQILDIKFTTDLGEVESWYNAMIIYDKD